MKLTPDAESRYAVQRYGGGATIEGVVLSPLRRFRDDGGSMTELARLERGAVRGLGGFEAAQVNLSTLAPGAIKAFHVHRQQTDAWFVPPAHRVLLVLLDVRHGSPTSGARMRLLLGDGDSTLVLIPPGVAHGCRNVGRDDATIVYFTDRHFDPSPERTDEGRLPWDLLGPDVWEAARD